MVAPIPRSGRPHFNSLAFNLAEKRYEELLASREFKNNWKLTKEATGQPYGSLRFWRLVARTVRGLKPPPAGNPVERQAFNALQVLGQTPLHLMCQDLLDRRNTGALDDVARVVRFGKVIKNFAVGQPDISTSLLATRMEEFANSQPISRRVQNNAERTITQRVLRSNRHELGVGQSLLATGRNFRPATIDEDIHGFDYVVGARKSEQPLRLDVKAGFRGMRRLGAAELPYVITDAGIIAARSGFTDEDFGDSFFVPDERAAAQANVLEEILNSCEVQLMDMPSASRSRSDLLTPAM